MMIKKLLRSHEYLPDGMDDAVETVMNQCELWTDNTDMEEDKLLNVNSRLISNLKFFAEQIEKKEIAPDEVYESIGKLQIVNITLDRALDDAQAIFESLNSTGKELFSRCLRPKDGSSISIFA